MHIQSLTLYLDEKQTRCSDVITSKGGVKVALNEVLSGIDVDLSKNDEQSIVLPLLIAEVKVSNSELRFSYTLIDAENGLLTLYYQDSKGRSHCKAFNQVTKSEVEQHLEQVLLMKKEAFIERYFPPKALFNKVVDVMAICILVLSTFCLGGLLFFPEVMWHDEVINQMWPIVALVYVISGVMLLPKVFSKAVRERYEMIGKGRIKQLFSFILVNALVAILLAWGGARILHAIYAKPAEIDIVFSGKARDYYNKHCSGSVNVAQFSGALCLENKAYWTVIKAGSQAKATGQLSSMGFTIEAIELK